MESPVVTNKMCDAGVSILDGSDFGSPYRVESDSELVCRIFVAMFAASFSQPAGRNSKARLKPLMSHAHSASRQKP